MSVLCFTSCVSNCFLFCQDCISCRILAVAPLLLHWCMIVVPNFGYMGVVFILYLVNNRLILPQITPKSYAWTLYLCIVKTINSMDMKSKTMEIGKIFFRSYNGIVNVTLSAYDKMERTVLSLYASMEHAIVALYEKMQAGICTSCLKIKVRILEKLDSLSGNRMQSLHK